MFGKFFKRQGATPTPHTFAIEVISITSNLNEFDVGQKFSVLAERGDHSISTSDYVSKRDGKNVVISVNETISLDATLYADSGGPYQEKLGNLVVRQRRLGSAGLKQGKEAFKSIGSCSLQLHTYATASNGTPIPLSLPLEVCAFDNAVISIIITAKAAATADGKLPTNAKTPATSTTIKPTISTESNITNDTSKDQKKTIETGDGADIDHAALASVFNKNKATPTPKALPIQEAQSPHSSSSKSNQQQNPFADGFDDDDDDDDVVAAAAAAKSTNTTTNGFSKFASNENNRNTNNENSFDSFNNFSSNFDKSGDTRVTNESNNDNFDDPFDDPFGDSIANHSNTVFTNDSISSLTSELKKAQAKAAASDSAASMSVAHLTMKLKELETANNMLKKEIVSLKEANEEFEISVAKTEYYESESIRLQQVVEMLQSEALKKNASSADTSTSGGYRDDAKTRKLLQMYAKKVATLEVKLALLSQPVAPPTASKTKAATPSVLPLGRKK